MAPFTLISGFTWILFSTKPSTSISGDLGWVENPCFFIRNHRFFHLYLFSFVLPWYQLLVYGRLRWPWLLLCWKCYGRRIIYEDFSPPPYLREVCWYCFSFLFSFQLLVALKMRYPQKITILRGNHEIR